jgi:hypothetical protein
MRFIRRVFSFLAWLFILAIAGSILSVGVLVGREALLAYRASGYLAEKSNFDKMAQQGDFIGGHLSAVLSAATLAVLIYSIYLQNKSSRIAQARAMFASGIDAISRYDTHAPGCPQALRLLDHYSDLALQYDRNEFYSLLNTVMTDEMRKTLRQPRCPYLNAVRVRRLISLRTALEALRRDLGWVTGTLRYYTGGYKKPL